MTAQLEWKQEVANGNVSISGSNLRIRDLVFRQLSTQCSVSNNVIYVKDCSAILNDSDFINATGSLNLRPPYHYNGKVSARVANLSTLEPLLRASGNENELAGSFALDWEGNGNAQTVKNSGKLKLVLEKGRYGDLKSVQANIDASYSPEGLDVPIIFSRDQQHGFSGNRPGKRRDAGDQQNSAQPGPGEICRLATSRSRSCGEISGRARQSCRPAEKSPPRFNPRIWTYAKFSRTSASNQWHQGL